MLSPFSCCFAPSCTVCLFLLACKEKEGINGQAVCVWLLWVLLYFLIKAFFMSLRILGGKRWKKPVYLCWTRVHVFFVCLLSTFPSSYLSLYSSVRVCERRFREGRFSCFIGPLFACPVITCPLHCLPLSDPPHNTQSQLTVGSKKSGGEYYSIWRASTKDKKGKRKDKTRRLEVK